MTTIPLYHLIPHFTLPAAPRQQRDFDANAIVRIIKQEPWNGYLEVLIKDSGIRRFTSATGEEFVPHLCRTFARFLHEERSGPFTLVPIPNRTALVGSAEDFRTLALARQVAGAIGTRVKVCPALRWKVAKGKAHQEETARDPREHYDNLAVVEKPEGWVALFDDVRTTGASLIAAYRRLRDAGHAPVFACTLVNASWTPSQKLQDWTVSDLQVDEEDPFE